MCARVAACQVDRQYEIKVLCEAYCATATSLHEDMMQALVFTPDIKPPQYEVGAACASHMPYWYAFTYGVQSRQVLMPTSVMGVLGCDVCAR